MTDFMNFFNTNEKANGETDFIVHESDGSYSWRGATGRKGDTTDIYYYNLRYLKKGAAYQVSYTAKTTRSDNMPTTGISTSYGKNTTFATDSFAESSEWTYYSYTFNVEDEFNMFFFIDWYTNDKTYFKNIRLECFDQDDFEKEVTSSTTLDIESDHTLYAKWSEYTWDDYAAESYASGSGTAVSPYIIKTSEQMAKLAKDSRSSNLAGVNFKLAADIDMRDHLWDAISDFGGVFDGDKHTISGISSVEGKNQGLFGLIMAPSCTIKNLFITNSVFYSSTNVGTFCAGVEGVENGGECNYFRLQNCIAQNITIISSDKIGHDSVGGLCGYVRCSDGLIENCMVDTCYISTDVVGLSGALAGTLMAGSTIKNSCALNVDLRGSAERDTFPTTRVYDTNCECYGTYVEFKKNGIMYKEIKGTQTQFEEGFFYNAGLNKGYPIPRALVSFSDTSMGNGTFAFLSSKGFQYIEGGVILV